MDKSTRDIPGFKISSLLRPYLKMLLVGFLGVLGEGVANLLEPWPLKVVLDNVLRSKAGARLAERVDSVYFWR